MNDTAMVGEAFQERQGKGQLPVPQGMMRKLQAFMHQNVAVLNSSPDLQRILFQCVVASFEHFSEMRGFQKDVRTAGQDFATCLQEQEGLHSRASTSLLVLGCSSPFCKMTEHWKQLRAAANVSSRLER